MNGTERRRHVLGIVANAVCRDRPGNYGDADDNFRDIAELWTWWLRKRGLLAEGKELTALDATQLQSMIKIARKLGNIQHLDSWMDDAGYNVCGAAIILSEELKKQPHEPNQKPV